MRAMSEQLSSTIGLLPAVEPSLLLMQSPVAALLTRYLPAAAVEAVTDQVWLALAPQVGGRLGRPRPDRDQAGRNDGAERASHGSLPIIEDGR
jgi:hypothetical protein